MHPLSLALQEFLEFQEFLERQAQRVHKVSWVLLVELGQWAVQGWTVLLVDKALRVPWATGRTVITVRRGRREIQLQ